LPAITKFIFSRLILGQVHFRGRPCYRDWRAGFLKAVQERAAHAEKKGTVGDTIEKKGNRR
jgi:hypothetical protein